MTAQFINLPHRAAAVHYSTHVDTGCSNVCVVRSAFSMLPVAVCDASRRLKEAKIRLAKAKKAAQEQEAAAA